MNGNLKNLLFGKRLIIIVGIMLTLVAAPVGILTMRLYTDAEAQEPEGGTYVFAPLPENIEDGTIIAEDSQQEATSESQMSILCSFTSEADNPHLSSTGFAASAHGWWMSSNSALCPSHADVSVSLSAYYCYYPEIGPTICEWRQVNFNEARIRPGGGSVNRTAARNDCTGPDLVGYRSIVDVDLVGVPDSYSQVTRYNDVNCYPEE